MAQAPFTQTLFISEDGSFKMPDIRVTIPGGVVVAPTLGTLSLSGSLQVGVAASGSIIGATSGSTITSNIPGITVNSIARTYSGTPTATGSGLTETLTGATGSPKTSAITVAAAAPTLGPLTLSSSSAQVGTSQSINILGATAGSSISGAVPDGMTINSGARTISGVPTTAGQFDFTLVETPSGGGTSRSSNVTVTVAAAPVTPTNVVTVQGQPVTVAGVNVTAGV